MGIPIRLCRASAPFSLAPSVLCLISFRFLMPYTVVNVASANPIIPSVLLLILGFITLPHVQIPVVVCYTFIVAGVSFSREVFELLLYFVN